MYREVKKYIVMSPKHPKKHDVLSYFWSPLFLNVDGTNGLAFVRPCVRPSVRSFVQQRSKNLFIGIFFFLGTKLGLPDATEVTFSNFARKILFGRFWYILVKK